jgi:hypothetical protein
MVPSWQQSPAPSTPRTRGAALSLFLVLGMIGNVVSSIFLVLGAAVMERVASDTSNLDGSQSFAEVLHKKMLFVAFLCVLNVVCLVGIWSWKRWGVLGYACCSLFGTFAGLSFNSGGAFGGLVFLLLFGTAIATKWQAFE